MENLKYPIDESVTERIVKRARDIDVEDSYEGSLIHRSYHDTSN